MSCSLRYICTVHLRMAVCVLRLRIVVKSIADYAALLGVIHTFAYLPVVTSLLASVSRWLLRSTACLVSPSLECSLLSVFRLSLDSDRLVNEPEGTVDPHRQPTLSHHKSDSSIACFQIAELDCSYCRLCTGLAISFSW